MAAGRRTTILEGMARDIPDFDMAMIDRLYASGNKSVATVAMLKAVRDYWIFLHREIDRLKKELRSQKKELQVEEKEGYSPKKEQYGDLVINYW